MKLHQLLPLQLFILLPLLLLLSCEALRPPPGSGASKLRSLLHDHYQQRQSQSSASPSQGESPKAIVLPGVHDALSAKIFATAGAQALFLSGFGVSATRLGEPDAGILTFTELEETARHVIAAVDAVASSSWTATTRIPVVVDGDTGFGGASNIRRTVRALARAGAAAITIEDQCFPKRCTVAAGSGVRVVSLEQSVERIRCALGARDEARDVDGNDVLIIARTDCCAALGLEEAIARCKAYEALGADIVYAENLPTREAYETLRSELKPQTHMMLAQVQATGHAENAFDAQEIGEMGISLALYGVTALQSYVQAVQGVAKGMLQSGVVHGDDRKLLSPFRELKKVVGFPQVDDFESNYDVEC